MVVVAGHGITWWSRQPVFPRGDTPIPNLTRNGIPSPAAPRGGPNVRSQHAQSANAAAAIPSDGPDAALASSSWRCVRPLIYETIAIVLDGARRTKR